MVVSSTLRMGSVSLPVRRVAWRSAARTSARLRVATQPSATNTLRLMSKLSRLSVPSVACSRLTVCRQYDHCCATHCNMRRRC